MKRPLPPFIPPLFKSDSAVLSFSATKDGKLNVNYQGWDAGKVVLEALARALDEDADFVVRAMGEEGSAAALLVYRRDFNVPPSGGLRTVGYHLALVRQ
jgi:hypothetical protein